MKWWSVSGLVVLFLLLWFVLLGVFAIWLLVWVTGRYGYMIGLGLVIVAGYLARRMSPRNVKGASNENSNRSG